MLSMGSKPVYHPRENKLITQLLRTKNPFAQYALCAKTEVTDPLFRVTYPPENPFTVSTESGCMLNQRFANSMFFF